jgi:hypothetical protein
VLDLGAPPAVDRLIVVAHHAQIAVPGRQALTMRYWLPLVSWYSSTSRWSNGRLVARTRDARKQFFGAEQQIVEVDGPGVLERRW